MSGTFQFVALPSEQFVPLFGRNDSELEAMGARRLVVDENPGFPCRVTPADAEVGEIPMMFGHRLLSCAAMTRRP